MSQRQDHKYLFLICCITVFVAAKNMSDFNKLQKSEYGTRIISYLFALPKFSHAKIAVDGDVIPSQKHYHVPIQLRRIRRIKTCENEH